MRKAHAASLFFFLAFIISEASEAETIKICRFVAGGINTGIPVPESWALDDCRDMAKYWSNPLPGLGYAMCLGPGTFNPETNIGQPFPFKSNLQIEPEDKLTTKYLPTGNTCGWKASN